MHKKQGDWLIGGMAAQALRLEAAATPKPGLVDKKNSGAHTDMDYPLFLVSADVLEPYFVKCTELGRACSNMEIFAKRLRETGIEWERNMFEATGGVNTHKGMVFSMGILCGSIGYLSERLNLSADKIDREALRKQCAQLADLLLGENASSDNIHAFAESTENDETHGAQVLRETGIRGIREEALSGFESAFTTGLSALKKAKSMGFDANRAMVYALMCLMIKVKDSNVVYRRGREGLVFLQGRATDIIGQCNLPENEWFKLISDLDDECIAKNISAGGCADMLAMSVMLYMIFEDYQWFLN